MKKYLRYSLTLLISAFLLSCENNYLDRSPESGIDENLVFTQYENYRKFFYAVYEGTWSIKNAYPFQATLLDYKGSWDNYTEISAGGYTIGTNEYVKGGEIAGDLNYFTVSSGAAAGFQRRMYTSIRICNKTLENIDRLQDATPEQKNDLIAQAHFVRAFAHFFLFKIWGRQPYITKALTESDPWDMVRLSNYETCMKIAADLDTAIQYYQLAGTMRRDDPPGGPTHLTHPDQNKPNGVAAKGLKSRVLLYAASPLNNDKGVVAWENAAKVSWEAIQLATQYGYTLLSKADYKKINCGAPYTNEHLWAYSQGNRMYLQSITGMIFTGSQSGRQAECPTQNQVDMYETAQGEPLNTLADRNAAAALGHYNEQNPYINREPRFYNNVIYNTADISASGFGTAKIYYEIVGGNTVYGELLNPAYRGRTYTGYMDRKQWADQTYLNPISVPYTDPILRLGELYLNYAEAANEAYGPNTPAPGATMTAVDAINFIRARVGHVPVLSTYTVDRETFRPRIKNERTIELIYEAHYFFDERRWMDAPQNYAGGIWTMDIEKLAAGYDPAVYPTGYRYTRKPIDPVRQTRWKPNMYYFPHRLTDAYTMTLFEPNPYW